MTKETFKPIPNYPGYEVSDLGRVRSLKRKRVVILRQSPDSNDYLRVGLFIDGRRLECKVANLVLLAFVGLCPKGMEVCHSDSNKLNNHLSNLRYDTHRENILDQWRDRPGGRKLPAQKIAQMRQEYALGEISLTSLARKHQVSMSAASLIVRGKRGKKSPGPIKGRDY